MLNYYYSVSDGIQKKASMIEAFLIVFKQFMGGN